MSAGGAGGVSDEEFQQVNTQLMTLKGELYEKKELAERALKKLADALSASEAKHKAMEAALVRADGMRQKAELERQKMDKEMKASKDVKARVAMIAEFEATKRQLLNAVEEQKEQTSALKSSMSMLFDQKKLVEDELAQLKTAAAAAPPPPPSVTHVPPPIDGQELSSAETLLRTRVAELEKQFSDAQSSLAASVAERERAIADATRANKLASDRESEMNRLLDEAAETKKQVAALTATLSTGALGLGMLPMGMTAPLVSSATANGLPKSQSGDDLPRSTSIGSMPSISPSLTSSLSAGSLAEAKRIADLETEVKALNEQKMRIIDSVSKKDEKLRASQEDQERFINKLGEKEKDIMTLRNQVEELTKQIRAANAANADKESKLKAMAGLAAQGQKFKATEEQLQRLTQAFAGMKQRFDAQEAKLDEQKDAIYMAEKAREDGAKVLSSTEEMCDAQRKKIEALTNQLADLQKLLTERMGQMEKESSDEKAAHERHFAETRASLEAQVKQLEEDMETKTSLLVTQSGALKNQYEKLTEAAEVEAKLRSELDEANAKLHTYEGQVNDLKMEGDIVSKKANRMVVELKAQLKKDALRVRELEVALAEARDDMQELHGALGRQTGGGGRRGTSGSDSEPASPGNSSHSSNGSSTPQTPPSAFQRSHTLSTIHQRHLSAGSSSPAPSPTSSSSLSASPARALPPSSLSTISERPGVSSAVDAEVSKHLAERLASVQDELFNAKRKVGSLEENVRFLVDDCNQKKEMIRNFVRRIETGALTTSDMSLTVSKKYAEQSTEAKNDMFIKMETVLQETTLQNIALRNDMKKLGAEVSRLSTKLEKLEKRNRELDEELNKAQHAYDEVRDEKELMTMTHEESASILRSTEEAIKGLRDEVAYFYKLEAAYKVKFGALSIDIPRPSQSSSNDTLQSPTSPDLDSPLAASSPRPTSLTVASSSTTGVSPRPAVLTAAASTSSSSYPSSSPHSATARKRSGSGSDSGHSASSSSATNGRRRIRRSGGSTGSSSSISGSTSKQRRSRRNASRSSNNNDSDEGADGDDDDNTTRHRVRKPSADLKSTMVAASSTPVAGTGTASAATTPSNASSSSPAASPSSSPALTSSSVVLPIAATTSSMPSDISLTDTSSSSSSSSTPIVVPSSTTSTSTAVAGGAVAPSTRSRSGSEDSNSDARPTEGAYRQEKMAYDDLDDDAATAAALTGGGGGAGADFDGFFDTTAHHAAATAHTAHDGDGDHEDAI